MCLHSSLRGSLLSCRSVTSRLQASKLLAEGMKSVPTSHFTDILADMLPRAPVILHQHWTLGGTGERRNHLLHPPSFVFSFVVDGVRLLNFCPSFSMVPHRGCADKIYRLSGLRPDLRQVDMLFVISFLFRALCFFLL